MGAVSKAKVINGNASQSTFNFTGQLHSQQGALCAQDTGEMPAATQPVENSQRIKE
jgi:hypothetical protein